MRCRCDSLFRQRRIANLAQTGPAAMDGRNIVILVLFGIAITARTMPVACMVMAARAVILMRRELGGSYRAKFALACLPCVRWRTFVPDQYWPVVERFRRRLVAA